MSSPPPSTSSGGRRKLRSRGQMNKGKRTMESNFDRIRQLRAAGGSVLSLHKDDEDDDEDGEDDHDEDMDDFVVDDDGSGYADNDDEPEYDYDHKYSRHQSKLPTSKKKPGITTMFKKAQLKAKPKVVVKEEPTASRDDDAFMASLMNDLEAPLPSTPSRRGLSGTASTKRRQPPATHSPYHAMHRAQAAVASMNKPSITDESTDDSFALPPPNKKVRADLVDDNDDYDDDDPFKIETTKVKVEQDQIPLDNDNDLLPKPDDNDLAEPLYDELDTKPQGQSWMDVQNSMMSNNSSVLVKQESTMLVDQPPTSNDNSALRMYWIDAFERNGTVYLFGKVPTAPGSQQHKSCCVKVSGIERNMFLLPCINPDTKERFTAMDMYSEFGTIALQLGLRLFSCKPVKRKYAFEIDDIPTSAEYLKVVYRFDNPYSSALPADLSGRTIERVLGTSYSALELFLLKRRMMGPCWLEISGASLVDESERISWCRSEYVADNPKHVRAMTDDNIEQARLMKVPPLTTMSLSLKTVMNHQDNRNEIVAIGIVIHHDVALDDSTPAIKRQNVEQLTLVRQLIGMPMPPGFQKDISDSQKRRGNLATKAVNSETILLNLFTALLQRNDPDVLVAHNFYGFDLDVLLHRMRALSIGGWSKLGRLRRKQWPKLQPGAGGMGESTYGERQMVAGRVVCDTYMASKDLIRSKSYSLTNLAAQELQIRREEIPFERIPEYFIASKHLQHFVNHTASDAFLAVALMFHLQALPLTRQLTNLAGNLWTRTLMGARAERNEYLLLHEFYRNKFIRPDKMFGGNSSGKQQKGGNASTAAATVTLKNEMAEAVAEDQQDDEDSVEVTTKAAGGSSRRKPAYLGGLVLEPKRGFYDRFVLLLDFNSLYPSIIQEFNICFTTVRRSAQADEVPELPSPDLPPGILPKLLKTLVDRRRMVKQLLKQPNLSAEEAQQLDVRQKALKLTANSMYGCLGFTYSRFYAKPLAMLITSRGREILQATRDLALSDGLEVIYGDTDSIMIATRSESLNDVYELGAQFKRRVNEHYRLLELDIDGVFKRLLLLKKKKYAALQITNAKKDSYGTKLETKGLDLVRRDWCDLSHDVSNYTLERLFSDTPKIQNDEEADNDEDAVLTKIHEHLRKVGVAVRTQKVPLDKYVIHKGLTKSPDAYTDRKSQPHVLVALRQRDKGVAVRAGETIPYVICDSKCFGDDAGSSYAERAHHPDEIRASEGKLYPDTEWYLAQQVLPPCARLLEPMEGTDMSTLAQCLGLDPSKYRGAIQTSSSSSNGIDALRTLDSQIPDIERFKYAQPFLPSCQQCKRQYMFEGIARHGNNEQDKKNGGLVSGLTCSHCGHLPSAASLGVQLNMAIRKHIREYYSQVMQCDEPSCGLRTRVLSTGGSSRCLRPQCTGHLHEVYSDKQLYHQLQYFAALLTVEKSASRLECTSTEVRVLCERHMSHIAQLTKVVDGYMAVSARKFVDLSSLFSFFRL